MRNELMKYFPRREQGGCGFAYTCLLALVVGLLPPLSVTAAERVSGPDVTVRENGDGTVTMSNGIVTLVLVTKTARLNSIAYTYHDGVETRTCETLKGAGQYYYGGFMLGDGTYRYALASDPAANGGDLADVSLVSETATNGIMEVHFSLLRGSPGFYSTGIMTHRKQRNISGFALQYSSIVHFNHQFSGYMILEMRGLTSICFDQGLYRS